MRRFALVLILALALICACALPAAAITVDASAAILIDAATGRIIYQQNAHQPLPPASTTKELTALVVLENVENLDDYVTLPENFANVGESSVYLEPGDSHTYRDLLYAMLLRSANDAAQALAIGVAGNEADFAAMMNERTVELGLTDSHWVNPHGLDDPAHLTSAYDLAMIARAAMNIPLFNEIIATPEYTLEWEDYIYDNVLYNHNQFLDLYEGADGVKTGYTSLSGSCLVGSATQDGLRLIGVVLNSADHYAAMTTLMDYGFNRYEAMELGKTGDVVGSIRVLNGDIDKVDVVLGSDVSIAVEQGTTFTPAVKYDFPLTLEAPFTVDQPIGSASYTDSAGNETKVDLYVAQPAELHTFRLVFSEVWQAFLSLFLG